MIKNQVKLQESCGKVAGARVLEVSIVPEVSMVCLVCCGRAKLPSQASLLVYSSHMPLYGTVWVVECGTMWHHESSLAKLSCGKVAGTLQEQGIWPPVHGFLMLVYWGFAPRPFGRQAPVRRQFKTRCFFCCGNKWASQKPWFFLLWEQKGLPATLPKPWFFCCRKICVFQKRRMVCHFWKNAGCSVFLF